MSQKGLVRGLGLVTLTGLVAGNIVGSGIYVEPGKLADFGPVALLAWVAVAIGYFPLTLVYGDLADAYPLAGGLQVYAQRAFGPLAGLVSAFLYWFSGVTASAAFVIGFVSYAQVFVPSLGNSLWAFLLGQAHPLNVPWVSPQMQDGGRTVNPARPPSTRPLPTVRCFNLSAGGPRRPGSQ